MNTRDHICGIINRQMQKLNVSPQELAAVTGDTPTSAYRWSRNALPRPDKIPAICEFLKISPNELFGFQENTDTPPVQEQETCRESGVRGGGMDESMKQMYEERIEDLRRQVELLAKTVERETLRSEKQELQIEKLQLMLEKQQEKVSSLLQENTLLKANALQIESDSRKKASGE
jgi:transcriptional regulator with XRE-family HTH domain